MAREYKNRKERGLYRTAPYGEVADHKEYLKHYYRENKERIAAHKADLQKHDLNYRLRAVLGTINQRCNDPRHVSYRWYGGRGVRNFLNFDMLKFMWIRDGADQMKKPSIDREDASKDYTFGNCLFRELEKNQKRAWTNKAERAAAIRAGMKGINPNDRQI